MSKRDREAATATGSTAAAGGSERLVTEGSLEHPLGEVRRQSMLAALARHSLDAPSLDDFLSDAAGAVADGLAIELVGVFERQPTGPELHLRAGVGWREDVVGRAKVAPGAKSQAGYTLVAGRVVSPDLEKESRFAYDPFLEAENARSGISVSIPGPDRPFGVLTAHSRRRRDFHAKEVEFLRDIAHVLGSAIERDRRQAAERARAERLRQTLDAAGVGVWEWNRETDTVTWSETLERLHGVEPGRIGGTFEEFVGHVHPDDRERVRGAISQAIEAGRGYRVEYRSFRRDGSVHWVEAKGAVVRDEKGRPIGMAGVCIDLDEHAPAATGRED